LLKNPIIAFLKLIRVENLIIIALTQFCIQFFVLSDFTDYTTFPIYLFGISLLSTILIAAGGYIINDYFDVKTDKINRPDTVVLDVVIKRRWAVVLHLVFSALGLVLGLYLALKCHALKLLTFQIVSIILLWFYSTNLKKQLLVGNFVVSLLTATIPIMPMVYGYYYFPGSHYSFTQLFRSSTFIYIVLAYSMFAFLTSFTREIIKDMEDYKGDIQTGCKTMPIVWGIVTSKVVTFFLILITLGILLLAVIFFLKRNELFQAYYLCFLVILPLLIIMFKTVVAKTNKDFKLASLILKFVMLFGIVFTYFI
jgi:4-hydroxybenzoate polyprenyltransferase